MGKDIKRGLFLGKYHFISESHSGQKQKSLVVFPPTADLLWSVDVTGEASLKQYRKIIPADYDITIISYDKNLPVNFTFKEIIDDFAQFIKEKKLGPAVIAGSSYGGKIALPFAAQYPELTEKIILIVSAHELSESGLEFCAESLALANSRRLYDLVLKMNSLYKICFVEWIAGFLAWLKWDKLVKQANPVSTFINAYKYIIRHNTETRSCLPNIKAKTLVLGGSEDPFFTEELYRETAQEIISGRVVIFKGAGHLLPYERRWAVKGAVADFLK